MKYLVNRETKEHKVATPLAESIIKGYPDFKDDWQLVEADADGWIPWNGKSSECPLPDNARCDLKWRNDYDNIFLNKKAGAGWAWEKSIVGCNFVKAYRPILAEKEEPGNHLGEDTTRKINEGIRRRLEAASEYVYGQARYAEPNKRAFAGSAGGIAISSLSVFDRLNSAIAVSESIPAIFAEINALLPDGYCVTRCAGQTVEETDNANN